MSNVQASAEFLDMLSCQYLSISVCKTFHMSAELEEIKSEGKDNKSRLVLDIFMQYLLRKDKNVAV